MKLRYVMHTSKPGRIIVSRILPGSDLLQAINSIIAEGKIENGIIVSAVGLLEKARLRNCKKLPEKYPITDVNRDFRSIEKPCEILTLSGDIYKVEGEDSIQTHAHVALSYIGDEKVSVVGGHLIEGCIVFGFAEVYIMELTEIEMIKRFDEETKTLQLFA